MVWPLFVEIRSVYGRQIRGCTIFQLHFELFLEKLLFKPFCGKIPFKLIYGACVGFYCYCLLHSFRTILLRHATHHAFANFDFSKSCCQWLMIPTGRPVRCFNLQLLSLQFHPYTLNSMFYSSAYTRTRRCWRLDLCDDVIQEWISEGSIFQEITARSVQSRFCIFIMIDT